MPLTTDPEFNAHPNFEIKVSDGGGGGGRDHTVDLLVTFNPLYLQAGAANPVPQIKDDTNGIVFWNGVACPANGKYFTLQLSRLRDGATNIGVIAIDLANGESAPPNAIVPVPEDFKAAPSARGVLAPTPAVPGDGGRRPEEPPTGRPGRPGR